MKVVEPGLLDARSRLALVHGLVWGSMPVVLGHGHFAGDQVLRRFAQVSQKQLRTIDVLARYGGEEFSVLRSETPAGEAGALIVAERLRKAIEDTSFEDIAAGLRVTVSIGAATYRPGESSTELYLRADEALYRAKAAGRNRIESELPADTMR